jgi:hypothetical protein
MGAAQFASLDGPLASGAIAYDRDKVGTELS